MGNFVKLFSSCSTLEQRDILTLMRDASTLADDQFCAIDTSKIMSSDAAKAPCPTDEVDLCQATLDAGVYTCEDDYCPTCPDKNQCDHTCEIPCTDTKVGGPGR
jgi:hypothetical protein